MAFSNSLYIADKGTLPAELPSVEQIESASEIFGDTTGRKVVGVGIHFIVKYGVQVDPLEGRTMIYLGQSTHVPVPRVYALFQSPEKDVTYIIMERIRGWNLNSRWPRMDQASKEIVSTKLRNVFEEMRKLETPGGYCSVGHGGLPDGLFWTNNPSNPFAGPFNIESKLNEAMIAKYVENGLSTYKANFYSRTFQDVFQNHSPVFSHADFQRKNVLIRTSTTTTGEEEEHWSVDNLELVIIDWEFSGWYPSYWEYARAVFACGRWDDDWNDWIDQILKPYRNEYAWVEILLRELWS
ncbi:kinase-like domain-containing protein [Phaeosphaeria sp. MPI-PUGE-AT-0046c]|nr:kinase-like domain-containing protein [Phaeosphaeria sp. MPI-PUGE-AT-0046c]